MTPRSYSLYAKDILDSIDKIEHWYFGVDYQVVWNVATEEIPQLKPLLQVIFASLD